MRKGFLFLGSFFMLLLFAGGMLFLLGAQERTAEESAAQRRIEPADPLPALNPGYSPAEQYTI